MFICPIFKSAAPSTVWNVWLDIKSQKISCYAENNPVLYSENFIQRYLFDRVFYDVGTSKGNWS
jgi:hypothetical protein